MLSSLLTQLQTQLLPKRFLLAGLLPVLLFIFGSGWMLYQAGLQSWFGKIDALKDPAILVLLVVAYLFSAINATLLEWLEGKSGILRLAAPW
jgi:hypothetical protein